MKPMVKKQDTLKSIQLQKVETSPSMHTQELFKKQALLMSIS